MRESFTVHEYLGKLLGVRRRVETRLKVNVQIRVRTLPTIY